MQSLGSKHKRKIPKIPGILISMGILLLAVICVYYAYATIARQQLDPLNYVEENNEAVALGNTKFSFRPGSISPLDWPEPRWVDVYEQDNTLIWEEFSSLDNGSLPAEAGSLPYPINIGIPSIGLNSAVKALEIINYGEARGWETPSNVVGHIPTTANPGEEGIGYFFGHLHTPIRGEGSVFLSLTLIPDLLRQGHVLDVVISNELGQDFLYRITETSVIHEDDFTLENSPVAEIVLVACVPKYIYDHRFMVHATLIGFK